MKRGTEDLWLLGEDLVHCTGRRAISTRNDLYMTNLFETKIFASSFRQRTTQQNVISRFVNSFALAINSQRKIPKWVVIIPEGDLLQSTGGYTEFGISAAYGVIIEFIMSSMDNMIQKFIGTDLPNKANKFNYPYFLWIEPTLHMNYDNNSLRMKFIKSLHTASLMHDRVIVLPLRQMWSDNSPNMFNTQQNLLSPAGLCTLWRGIDQAVRFADIKMLRKFWTLSQKSFSETQTAGRC